AAVDGRVEKQRLALGGNGGVAAPQISVQERGPRAVPLERSQDRLSLDVEPVASRQFEMGPKAPFAPVIGPVAAPGVRLRRRADVVVAPPAKARCGLAMRFGERTAKRGVIAFP